MVQVTPNNRPSIKFLRTEPAWYLHSMFSVAPTVVDLPLSSSCQGSAWKSTVDGMTRQQVSILLSRHQGHGLVHFFGTSSQLGDRCCYFCKTSAATPPKLPVLLPSLQAACAMHGGSWLDHLPYFISNHHCKYAAAYALVNVCHGNGLAQVPFPWLDRLLRFVLEVPSARVALTMFGFYSPAESVLPRTMTHLE